MGDSWVTMEGNQRECAEMAETPYVQGFSGFEGIETGAENEAFTGRWWRLVHDAKMKNISILRKRKKRGVT